MYTCTYYVQNQTIAQETLCDLVQPRMSFSVFVHPRKLLNTFTLGCLLFLLFFVRVSIIYLQGNIDGFEVK